MPLKTNSLLLCGAIHLLTGIAHYHTLTSSHCILTSTMNAVSVERRISDVVYDLDSTFGFRHTATQPRRTGTHSYTNKQEVSIYRDLKCLTCRHIVVLIIAHQLQLSFTPRAIYTHYGTLALSTTLLPWLPTNRRAKTLRIHINLAISSNIATTSCQSTMTRCP